MVTIPVARLGRGGWCSAWFVVGAQVIGRIVTPPVLPVAFKDWPMENKYEWYLEQRLYMLSQYSGGRIFPPAVPPPWDEAAMNQYHADYGPDTKWDGRYDSKGKRGMRPWQYWSIIGVNLLLVGIAAWLLLS